VSRTAGLAWPRRICRFTVYTKGRLYRIFQTVEDAYHDEYGEDHVTEHRQIEFQDTDLAGGKFLVVRHQKHTEPGDKTKRNRETHACTAYRWDAQRFMFAEVKSGANKLCAQHWPN